MLYPWGKWPEQPSDWELFHFIRDDVHANISDIPIRNANQGLYPNCGTSRDYGYGVMGYPTFTFETDDEQFLLGTVEALSDRLGEELDVMRYLIQDVWYWRARLVVESIEVMGNDVDAHVVNLGRASTSNASLRYMDPNGELLWNSSLFGVNATNETKITLDGGSLSLVEGGTWSIYYQKRVVDASMWVEEAVNESVVESKSGASGSNFLPSPSVFLSIMCIFFASFGSRKNEV